jgi:hypothetical protein
MFSNTLGNMYYLRTNAVPVICSTLKRTSLNRTCHNCISTSTISFYNAKNGVNDNYESKKDSKKSQGPNTVYRDPVRQVFISQSNDVFTNLALEDWLYKNHDFDHKVKASFKIIDIKFWDIISNLRNI